MKVVKFELKKLWRQKKVLWIFLIVLLCSIGIFMQNFSKQSLIKDRAFEKIKPYVDETDYIYMELNTLARDNEFDDMQAGQFEYSNKMATAFFQWKSAIYKDEWDKTPAFEADFLTNLQQFELFGGEFNSLKGIERDYAFQKNDWLIAHNLPHVDEEYSLSPALILKDNTKVFFSIIGIFILLLFFGNTITVEKEQNTWLTLRTQPISKWKLMFSKYVSSLAIIIAFITMVVGIGLIIPVIFGDETMNFQYPLLVTSGEDFAIITVLDYLFRNVMLFICASLFAFSLIFLISTWVKNSFSAFMLTGFTVLIGYFATDLNAPFHSALNPFYFFQFPQILSEIPQPMDLLYPVAALFWSLLLVAFATLLPEKDLNLFGFSENRKPYRQGITKKYRITIWNISVFDWRKMWRNGLLKQLYIILSLVIILGFIAINQQAKELEFEYMANLDKMSKSSEEAVIHYKEELASFPGMAKAAEEAGEIEMAEYYRREESIADMNYIIDFFIETSEKEKAAVTAYKQQDWIPFYEYQLYENRYANGEFDSNAFFNQSAETFGKFTLAISMAEKEWLMAHNIRPVFTGEFVPTIHNNWQDLIVEKKEWETRNRKIDSSGLFSLYIYLKGYFYFIPLLLLFFLVGAGFSNEQGKKRTLQLLKTQPIAEKEIFLGKGIFATIFALISSIGLFGLVILVGTVFNRFGDWNYPVLRYVSKQLMETTEYTGVRTSEGGGHFIPLGDYLMESIALFLCVLLFLISLSFLFSLFIKSQMGVFATTILLAVIGYIGSTELLDSKVHLSPFTYLNTSKVTNGEFSALFNNPSITVQTGSILLLVATIIIFSVGYLLAGRKNKITNYK